MDADTVTLPKRLRDAAMVCSNYDYRMLLRFHADLVQGMAKEFAETPNTSNLTLLNGVWARAQRVLTNVPPEAPPAPPVSGPAEPARLAA